MRAHQLNEDGLIINTIEVESLDFCDGLIDADIGGSKGDSIIDGILILKPTPLPTVADYTDAVQAHLDAAAKAKHYDNIVSACSYAGAPNPFQDEGIAFVAWRGNAWAMCYSIMADVETGGRTQPTIAELIAELPQLPA